MALARLQAFPGGGRYESHSQSPLYRLSKQAVAALEELA